MAKEIMETTIYNEIYKIMSSRDYGWGDNASSAIIRSTIEGMAAFLGQKKNKDFPVSVGIYDNNDKFHFGGIVEFQKAEEEGGDEGSWSIVFTFDENDITVTVPFGFTVLPIIKNENDDYVILIQRTRFTI